MEAIEFAHLVEYRRISRLLRPKWRVFPPGGFENRYLGSFYWICSSLKHRQWRAAFGWFLHGIHMARSWSSMVRAIKRLTA